MTKRLSKADLTAIRERAEKATQGRWYYEVDGDLYSDKTRDRVMYPYMSSESIPYIKISESDATFIAYARQDIPKLLAEIERLRETLDKTLTAIDEVRFEELYNEVYEILYGGDRRPVL